jgi:hypothetical protein
VYAWLFVVLFAAYVLTASGRIGGDGWRRYCVTRSLVERGTFEVPRDTEKAASRDAVAGPEGRAYARYGLGQSLTMVPLYLLGRAASVAAPQFRQYVTELACSGLNQVLAALTAVALLALLRKAGMGSRAALAATLVYAFGTFAWQQSKDTFEHPQVTLLFVVAALLLSDGEAGPRPWRVLLAGACVGFAFLTRLTAGVGAVALAVFLVDRSWRTGPGVVLGRLGVFAAGAAPFVLLFGWYNYVRFGSVLATGYGATFPAKRPFSTPLWEGLAGLLVSPGRGLFVFCPVLILGAFGIRRVWRRDRPLGWLAVLMFVGYVVLYATFVEWHGAWCWGPRFVTVVLPFLSVFVAGFFDGVWPRLGPLLRGAAFAVVGVSVAVQVLSVAVSPVRAFVRHRAMERAGFEVERFWTLRHAQIVTQLGTLRHVVEMTATRRPGEFVVGKDLDDREAVDRLYGLNSFDVWWVKVTRLGVSPWLSATWAAGLLAVLLVVAWRLRRATTGAPRGR